jgi:hypothetical protein
MKLPTQQYTHFTNWPFSSISSSSTMKPAISSSSSGNSASSSPCCSSSSMMSSSTGTSKDNNYRKTKGGLTTFSFNQTRTTESILVQLPPPNKLNSTLSLPVRFFPVPSSSEKPERSSISDSLPAFFKRLNLFPYVTRKQEQPSEAWQKKT